MFPKFVPRWEGAAGGGYAPEVKNGVRPFRKAWDVENSPQNVYADKEQEKGSQKCVKFKSPEASEHPSKKNGLCFSSKDE